MGSFSIALYGILVVATGIGYLATLLYTESLTNIANIFITLGYTSEQTASAFDFVSGVYVLSPPFLLILLSMWLLNKSRSGPAGTSGWMVWEAVGFYLVGCILSLTLIVVGGAFIDIFHNVMISSGLFTVPAEWDNYTAYQASQTGYYIIVTLLPLIAGGLGLLTVFERYTQDDLAEDPQYPGGYSGGRL